MSSTLPAPAVPSTGDSPQGDEKAIRAQARRRSSLCPGAGWALLGYRGRGNLVLFCVAVWLVALAWLVLTLSPASIWAAGICTFAALVVWTAEWLDVGWCVVRSPAKSPLVSRFGFVTTMVWVAGLMLPLLLVLSFGSIDVDSDDRMLPAIEPGERLIFHRRVFDADLKRGAVIVFRLQRTAQGGTPGEQVIARILAVPDDELTVRNDHYVVNGDVTPYRARDFKTKTPLNVPAYPRKLVVPATRYFVVQDSPETGIDSQQLDFARRMDIVSARLFHFGRRGLMRPLE